MNRTLRPGKRSRAKLKPTSDELNTVPTTLVRVMNREFFR
jgi:hypothetical protein